MVPLGMAWGISLSIEGVRGGIGEVTPAPPGPLVPHARRQRYLIDRTVYLFIRRAYVD